MKSLTLSGKSKISNKFKSFSLSPNIYSSPDYSM